MHINNQIIDDELIPEKRIIIQDIKPLLEKEFGIEGFGVIYLFSKQGIKEETEAVKELITEDSTLENSYWVKTKAGHFPGKIDPQKIVVIANLDTDVPICIYSHPHYKNPPIIWIGGEGWEQICRSHEKFISIFNPFGKNV